MAKNQIHFNPGPEVAAEIVRMSKQSGLSRTQIVEWLVGFAFKEMRRQAITEIGFPVFTPTGEDSTGTSLPVRGTSAPGSAASGPGESSQPASRSKREKN